MAVVDEEDHQGCHARAREGRLEQEQVCQLGMGGQDGDDEVPARQYRAVPDLRGEERPEQEEPAVQQRRAVIKRRGNLMIRMFLVSGILFLAFCIGASAQPDRWQQRVKYTMNVDVDVTTNRFTGNQTLVYTNNSPDTLAKVFYHLYWNAFQPGSMMDTRSRELGKIVYSSRRRGGEEQRDWDDRVKDRILNLKPEEIGYQHVLALTMNGAPVKFKEEETILEVELPKAILPHTAVTFQMKFEAQVPLQIRRSGRGNPHTGVRDSVSQWDPKMCGYDYEGLHPTPYVGGGVFWGGGGFDV